MLKSRFDLSTKKEEVEELHEEYVAPEQPEEVGGEEIVEAEEVRIVYPDRLLSKPEISIKLCMLGKTADGDGYTYLKASCTNMGITKLDMFRSFKQLLFVDVSQNNLTLEGLQVLTELPYIVLIHADNNQLDSAALNKAKYLQVLILNNNMIKTVEDVYQPELCTLEVGYNQINKIDFINRMPHLKVLDFRYNIITEISNVDFPNLDSLYLAGNKIKSLLGLERLVNLRILHLRYNPIRNLDGFDSNMTKLHYVNLRNCKIATLKQVKKLRALTALETLVLKGCPYMGGTGEEEGEVAAEEEDAELRVEILAALPRLKRLNKTVYSPEERTEAKDLMMQWFEEGEKDEEEVLEEEFHEEESNVED